MKADQSKGAPKKSTARSANANAPTKARTSSVTGKKASATKGSVAKKSAPAKKAAPAGKMAKGSPKAFARGGLASAIPSGGPYIQRQLGGSLIAQAAKALISKKAAPAVAKKAAPAVAKKAAPTQDKLVPFAGWAPLTSAADIASLQKARALFSEDQSFED